MFQKRQTIFLFRCCTHTHTHIRLEYNYTLFRGFVLSVISMSSRPTGRKYDAPQRDGGKRRNRKIRFRLCRERERNGIIQWCEHQFARGQTNARVIIPRRRFSLDFSLEINGIPISHRSRRSKLRQLRD